MAVGRSCSTAAVRDVSNLIIRYGPAVEEWKTSRTDSDETVGGSNRQGLGGTNVRWLHRCAHVRIRSSDAVKLQVVQRHKKM
jgi:hypothetical protein